MKANKNQVEELIGLTSNALDQSEELLIELENLKDDLMESEENFFIACTLLDMHAPLINGISWYDLILENKVSSYS